MEHTIDAKGKVLGRVASAAAVLLMGKNSSQYERNKVLGNKIHIINASKTKMNPKKLKTTVYVHYTGYPSGLRKETMEKVIAKKGYEEIYRRAVYGMLPANKLRPRMMKNLIVTE